jgi:hypothetical protein
MADAPRFTMLSGGGGPQAFDKTCNAERPLPSSLRPQALLDSRGLQAQPAKKQGQPSLWVRALRIAAGVGRYKKYGAEVDPGEPSGPAPPSAVSWSWLASGVVLFAVLVTWSPTCGTFSFGVHLHGCDKQLSARTV